MTIDVYILEGVVQVAEFSKFIICKVKGLFVITKTLMIRMVKISPVK